MDDLKWVVLRRLKRLHLRLGRTEVLIANNVCVVRVELPLTWNQRMLTMEVAFLEAMLNLEVASIKVNMVYLM
jgi:hypothetical protein